MEISQQKVLYFTNFSIKTLKRGSGDYKVTQFHGTFLLIRMRYSTSGEVGWFYRWIISHSDWRAEIEVFQNKELREYVNDEEMNLRGELRNCTMEKVTICSDRYSVCLRKRLDCSVLHSKQLFAQTLAAPCHLVRWTVSCTAQAKQYVNSHNVRRPYNEKALNCNRAGTKH